MSAPPEAYEFAFSIVDDTDLATLAGVRPVYDLLASLGLLTTKTVWALPCTDDRNPYACSATLADREYAAWVRDLREAGFEIAFHGASAGSNSREATLRGLEVFDRLLGTLPVMHLNHHRNLDNLYWGTGRFDLPLVRGAVRLASKNRDLRFEGHLPGSPYFWGDICESMIHYCRNFTFSGEIDILRLNPTLPYADPRRPLVRRWFSAADGGNPERFVRLLSEERLQELVRGRGVCIVYAHFGAGFVRDGRVLPEVEAALRNVAALGKGLCVPASTLLDMLSGDLIAPLPAAERRRIELTWLWSKIGQGGTS